MKIKQSILFGLLSMFMIPSIAKSQDDSSQSQSYRHVEIVTFKPGTSDANKHMVDKSYRQAADAFPMVKAFEWGWDDNDKTQTKRVYVTTFNNKGDLTTYNSSPQHQAVLKTNVVSVASITTVDYPVNK